jgi:hypothetical protein
VQSEADSRYGLLWACWKLGSQKEVALEDRANKKPLMFVEATGVERRSSPTPEVVYSQVSLFLAGTVRVNFFGAILSLLFQTVRHFSKRTDEIQYNEIMNYLNLNWKQSGDLVTLTEVPSKRITLDLM